MTYRDNPEIAKKYKSKRWQKLRKQSKMTYRDNPEIAKKYKSKRWQKLRKQKLILNPLCERCLKKRNI